MVREGLQWTVKKVDVLTVDILAQDRIVSIIEVKYIASFRWIYRHTYTYIYRLCGDFTVFYTVFVLRQDNEWLSSESSFIALGNIGNGEMKG